MPPMTSPPRLTSRRIALTALLLVAPGVTTRAEPVQYEYGGVITAAGPSTGVAPGTRFDGTFTYDPSSQVLYPTFVYEGHTGDGIHSEPAAWILNVGGHQVFESNLIGIVVDYGPKFSSTPSAQDPAMTAVSVVGMTDQLGITLKLTNPSRSVFPPTPIPASFSLDDFPERQLWLIDRASHRGETLFGGTIDTLTPVPEPTTLSSFLVVIGGMALRHRLRRPSPRRPG